MKLSIQSKWLSIVIFLAVAMPSCCGELIPPSQVAPQVQQNDTSSTSGLVTPLAVAGVVVLGVGSYYAYHKLKKGYRKLDMDKLVQSEVGVRADSEREKNIFQRFKDWFTSFFLFGADDTDQQSASSYTQRVLDENQDNDNTDSARRTFTSSDIGNRGAMRPVDPLNVKKQLSEEEQKKCNDELHRAANLFCFDLNKIKKVVHSGADINSRDEHGETALHRAAQQENAGRVQSLLQLNAKVDVRDKHGRTPLMAAARGGWHEAVGVLLRHKARTDLTDKKGRTALSLAEEALDRVINDKKRRAPYEKMVRLLTRKADDEKGDTNGDKRLIDNQQKRNVADKNLGGGLIRAVESGFIDKARQLLEDGADPNAIRLGYSALELAVCKNNRDMLQLLLQHGADVNASQNKYILKRAVHTDRRDVAKELLRNGCNANATDSEGKPVVFSIKSREMLELLLSNKCDLSIPDKDGNTVLETPSLVLGTKIIKLLLKSGAPLPRNELISKTRQRIIAACRREIESEQAQH